MCGIAGALYADRRPVSGHDLRRMAAVIAHRGPDGEGFWTAPGVGLAHRRLAIIDLAGGGQPLGNEDGSIQVVFNGEIYNYRELGKWLTERGHRLATDSDTEVIVHLYEEFGAELVHKLRGMFAFAIWDNRRGRLVLARDRVGLKPLYVYRDSEKLVFGSELKAILAHGEIDRQVDPAGLEDYFAWGVIPGERSIFRRVSKLPAGHVLQVGPDDLSAAPRRYWRYEPAVDESLSESAWRARIEEKLHDSVAAHTVADVPVGAFLSGGLDSSIVVSLLAQGAAEPPQTFSIGFQEAAFNELSYARQVADTFHCRHREAIVSAQAAASLDRLVHFFDEPFADSSAIPTMHVARLARESVKVVLTGDGGDEAFGGYSRYAHDLREARLRRALPGWLRRGALGPLARVWPKADWLPRLLRAKTLLTNVSLEGAAAYANTLSWRRSPSRRRLLAADIRQSLNGHDCEERVREAYGTASPRDPLAGMIAADVNMLLPDDFLTKVDRATMSYGLEARPPLVDHELLELTARMPSQFKVHRGETKHLLKQIYRPRLPADVTTRRKQGFEIPVDKWLRGPLVESFQDHVLAPGRPVGDLVDQDAAARLFRQHRSGVGRHGNVLWALLVLGKWAETYLNPGTGSASTQREKASCA